MLKNIYISGGSINYYRPFEPYGMLTENIEEADVVVFTGGEDVSPHMYKQPPHPQTSFNPVRDADDMGAYLYAKAKNIPMVGICRGSQFLCVMNGGELVQHVTNHAVGGTHGISTHDGQTVRVTSTHHQMANPKGRYVLLAWAEGLSNTYEQVNDDEEIYQWEPTYREEPEAVYYPDTKSLGVQFHPEYMGKDTDGWKYFQQLLKEFVL